MFTFAEEKIQHLTRELEEENRRTESLRKDLLSEQDKKVADLTDVFEKHINECEWRCRLYL